METVRVDRLPEKPSLVEREVRIHTARLDRPRQVVDRLARMLSTDETERAARFHFQRDRDRFVVGRACLRVHLGRYLERPPELLRFSYEDRGKPALDPPERLAFNLAHAEGLAVYAVCLDAEVGVDVEPFQAEPPERVPERFFSPAEVTTLRALPDEEQPAAFLRCWTRKEAFLKARGDGLSLPLDAFDVTLAPGDAPRLVRTGWDADEAAEWSLHDLSSSFPGYVAALAVRGGEWDVHIEPLAEA